MIASSVQFPFPGLEAMRDWLLARLPDGVFCPLCGQFAKIYRRKITCKTAEALVLMRRHELESANPAGEYIYMPGLLDRKQADETKARYWGLIEEKPEKRDDGGRVGWWRLTIRGRRWVDGVIKVPKYAQIYNKECLELHGNPVSIRDALGTKFNYDDLMRGV